MFVVHQDISKNHPDVVKEIYRMLVESRNMAPESVTSALPPVGLEANRKTLQMALDWTYEQKMIPRRLSFDELFDDTTAALGSAILDVKIRNAPGEEFTGRFCLLRARPERRSHMPGQANQRWTQPGSDLPTPD